MSNFREIGAHGHCLTVYMLSVERKVQLAAAQGLSAQRHPGLSHRVG
jgi:hypothetical protein